FYLPDTREIRLAYGSVGPTVIRAYEAEQLFREGRIPAIPDCIERAVKPITDQRSTAEYRRYLCRVLTEEFLTSIKC
ncbi:MAG: dehydrogenase, partial [Candidatus Neomarinimicrobiota bacterium]